MKYPPRKAQHPEIVFAMPQFQETVTRLEKLFALAGGPPTSTGQLERVVEELNPDDGEPTTDYVFISMLYAMMAWNRSGRPVYYLEEELARTLLSTELPMRTMDLPIWLPDNGMWVALPRGLFALENNETGLHEAEGFYLTTDLAAVVVDPEDGSLVFDYTKYKHNSKEHLIDVCDERHKAMPCISCLGVGTAKKGPSNTVKFRDDALIVFHLMSGAPVGETRNKSPTSTTSLSGVLELERLALNLLYALGRTRSVRSEERTPELPKGSSRRVGRAERALAKAGKSVAPYTILSLSPAVKRAAVAAAARSTDEEGRRIRYEKRIPGHFHKYWVLSPGEEHVLETKEGKGGTLHLVEHLLAPYTQGAGLGPKPEKTVVVRK